MKILTVFGTRPEAIKMAPLIQGLRAIESIELRVCVTGQHRQMLDQALAIFQIKPDYDLDIMREGQCLNSLTAGVLRSIAEVYRGYKPDLVMVHGDTTTTFAASLAAFYEHIPIGHVEAGLRTGNIRVPYPEEANRKLTCTLARFHFAPTESSKNNLLKEGVSNDLILVTGNTVIDAILMIKAQIEHSHALQKKMSERFCWEKMILITGHRRESFGEGFQNICHAVRMLALKFPEIDFVYPVHLNPSVQQPVNEILGPIQNVHLIEPQDYLSFVYLMMRSYLILTDSGGIQEEAPALGKPVLVMRDTTERPEAIVAGTALLVGTNINKIVDNVSLLLQNQAVYQRMARAHNPYGDGFACKRIIDFLIGKTHGFY